MKRYLLKLNSTVGKQRKYNNRAARKLREFQDYKYECVSKQ